jgi:hypothetical protein
MDAARWLGRLERAAREFGTGAEATKLQLLERTLAGRLGTARGVRRLHDVLLWLRSLPDGPAVGAAVEAALRAFAERPDVRRLRANLVDSGIAGMDLRLGFYAPMARWAARRWPERLDVAWDEVEDPSRLDDRVHLLALDAETPGLSEAPLTGREWLERMKGPGESAAAFLVRRVDRLGGDPALRDLFLEEMGLPLVLRGGADTPATTNARLPGHPTWRTTPLRRERPDLGAEWARPPRRIRDLSPREGAKVVELALEAMATRSRALDAFSGADPADVRMVDAGDGLELAVIGQRPGWRMLLESVYGWLLLRNGVPTGYVLTSALFGSSEVAYNVFDPWRGGEAAWAYARVLATARALFGSDTFAVYPYQLGHENEEGLASGAWWFYRKLGFEPRDPAARAVMAKEEARLARNPRLRTSRSTLERLARATVFRSFAGRREVVIGTYDFARLGLAVTDLLAQRFGSSREEGEQAAAEEVAASLGVQLGRLPAALRATLRRWAPMLLLVPRLARWRRSEKAALLEVLRAKGSRRESDFVARFDGHQKLRAAIERLGSGRR